MRIVVAGASQEGLFLAGMLSEQGWEVVLIERDQERLNQAEDSLDVMTVTGDPTHRSVLRRAQVEGARGFVALSDSDSDNMLSAALAKAMGVEIAVARVDQPEFYATEDAVESGVLQVDLTLCSTRLATTGLVNLLMGVCVPYVGTFASNAVRVALVPLTAGSSFEGKSPNALGDGRLVRAEAVVRDGFVRHWTHVARLEAGDQVLVAGPDLAVLDVWRKLAVAATRHRAMIVGAGDVGSQLAARLGGRIQQIEVIEKSREQAGRLARQNGAVTVLEGDARSVAFLQNQQIESVEYLLAVTGDDEVNLLVSLLGRKLGVNHTFTLLHRPGYAELYAELGVEGTIGTFALTTRAIQEAIATAGMVRSEPLPGTGYVLTEWRLARRLANGGGDVGVRMSDLPLPMGAYVLAAGRGPQPLRTDGDLVLQGRETLVIACPNRELESLGRALKNVTRGRER